MPACTFVSPMVNQSCDWCTSWLFQTFANTNADKTALVKIAIVDTQPDTLFHLVGKEILIMKASKGINTAARVKWIVRVSMAFKKSFKFI